MKYKRHIGMLLVGMLTLIILVSCEMKLPNPLIGAFRKPKDAVTDEAAICFFVDNTFEYYQFAGTEIWKVTGTYSLDLYAFDFINADGVINFRDVVEPAYADRALINETCSLLFDWTCDKNLGPQNMNLVFDPDDPTKNYFFEYLGTKERFDSEIAEWQSQITPQGDAQ